MKPERKLLLYYKFYRDHRSVFIQNKIVDAGHSVKQMNAEHMIIFAFHFGSNGLPKLAEDPELRAHSRFMSGYHKVAVIGIRVKKHLRISPHTDAGCRYRYS